MPKLFLFGALTNVQMLLHTWLKGRRAGEDAFGNVYYRGRARAGTKRERRWVIYPGAAEASLVPPEWHGWLHHQTDAVPMPGNAHRRDWQKPHLPNMTGTAGRYLPPSMKSGQREAATGDYTPWRPRGDLPRGDLKETDGHAEKHR